MLYLVRPVVNSKQIDIMFEMAKLDETTKLLSSIFTAFISLKGDFINYNNEKDYCYLLMANQKRHNGEVGVNYSFWKSSAPA
jgi:hypothetical protein